MLLHPWDTLAKLHNTVRYSAFGTTAKFVLSIFDVSDDGPLKAFTEGDVKAFSILRECDVGEMLQRYQRYLSIFKDYGYQYDDFKEDCKMQLTLELRRARGYHVLDTLFVEAWKCVKFEKLVNLENSELYVFVRSFKCGLFSLAQLKISAVHPSVFLFVSYVCFFI